MDKESCFKYFDGKATPEEESALFTELSASAEAMAQFRTWEAEWAENCSKDRLRQMKFNWIRKAINRKKRLRIFKYASFAAAVMVAVAAGFILNTTKDRIQPARYATTYQEKTKVTLPDSTIVWLNSASELSYDSDFNRKDRVVTLSGEACFDVTKDTRKPFIVKMKGCSVTALGTKFNITAYSGEPCMTAALIEGSIRFSVAGSNVVLHPNEMIEYHPASCEIRKMRVDASRYTSWIEGNIDYTDISLKDLFTHLSSIYGSKNQLQSRQIST